MNLYAYIHENRIVEFKTIPQNLYDMWIQTNNPKKNVYRIVIYSPKPIVTSSKIAEETFTIESNSVLQTWIVRDKTPDELRSTWSSYEFLNKFTYEERTAIRNAAKTDNFVADFFDLIQLAPEIHSDDEELNIALDYLTSLAIITEQRKTEILTN